MKTIYLECKMGIAGDMLMSSLYDLMDDAQQEEFFNTMRTLAPSGIELTPSRTVNGGISGQHMHVHVLGVEEASEHDHHHEHHHEHSHDHEHDHGHGHSHHHHATPASIEKILDDMVMPEEVRANAKAVYNNIAEAEAHAHGTTIDLVHYHEVGALDAVADVVGCCLAMHILAPDQILASPVNMGSGTVKCAHGIIPVPAPATAHLLLGLPSYSGDVETELTTPTGAALLKHFVSEFGKQPIMVTEKIGVGCGSKEFPNHANILRAFLGDV